LRLASDTIVDSRFRVVSPIRSGGMGSVYLAQQLDLDRKVALKFLHPELDIEKAFKRFRREAQILSNLHHPNIVAVHCFGRWEDSFYISMEYVEARGLDEVIRLDQLTKDRINSLFEQICAAISCAHLNGVIHRDIKPSNVLVTADGVAKVIDFGLSKPIEVSQNLTEPGSAVGTVSYMSPEQCMSKDIDHRSDIYSLGCLLYHMVAGKPPFIELHPAAVMSRHVNSPMPKLPADKESCDFFDAIIGRCTQKEPADRYQTVDALLDEFLGRTALVPRPIVAPKSKKQYFVAISGSVLALVIGALLVFNAQKSDDDGAYSELPLVRLRSLSEQLLQKGNYAEAIKVGQAAVRRNQSENDLATSYEFLWTTHMGKGKYDEALAVASDYAKLKIPHGYPGIARLAETYAAKDDWNNALKVWQELQQKRGMRSAHMHAEYAKALRHLGKYEEAAGVARQGLSGIYKDSPPDGITWPPHAAKVPITDQERTDLERELQLSSAAQK
jgi:serine/threonine protein kinase